MAIRWERVLLAASVLTMLTRGVVPMGEHIIHRYRLNAADGTWCLQMAANGTYQPRYGAENCGLR